MTQSKTPTRFSTGTRGVMAMLVILFFALQLGRFFVVGEVGSALCPSDRETDSVAGSSHQHDEDAVKSLPADQQRGYSLTHCRDTYDGIYMTPVQPLGLSAAVTHFAPQSNWSVALSSSVSATEQFLPTPFQPPRIQS